MAEAPLVTGTPLLRIPPFPGAQRHALAGKASERLAADDAAIDAAIDALAEARVGGDYWERQPPLPDAPYTLVRVRDDRVRERVIASLPDAGQILCWTEEPRGFSEVSTSVVSGRCDPWFLIDHAAQIIADPHDEVVAIAALAGRAVRSPEGSWLVAPGEERVAARAIVRDQAEQYRYIDPFTGDAVSFLAAIELCGFWRRLVDGNRPFRAAFGFAGWKKPTAAPLLWAGTGEVPFATRPRDMAPGDEVAAWKSRVAPATLGALARQGAKLVEVEDGFIRSIGLGADCVPPLSLVVDRLGAYFDPQQPSELENLLQFGDFSDVIVDRARELRALIVDLGVSKYGVGQERVERRTLDRRHILVPGQVEDDRSVLCGGGAVRTNRDLLARVRQCEPDAFIIYKPHPDVEAGHRTGAMSGADAAAHADEVIRHGAISALIDMVDEVHVNTSLAGFEALMRGKPVTTHGVPFYAGWGLTRDLGEVPERRTARRTLDELVSAVLLLYPRYLDPVTGFPCTPEILLRRLAEGAASSNAGPLVPLRRVQGYVRRHLAALRPW